MTLLMTRKVRLDCKIGYNFNYIEIILLLNSIKRLTTTDFCLQQTLMKKVETFVCVECQSRLAFFVH